MSAQQMSFTGRSNFWEKRNELLRNRVRRDVGIGNFRELSWSWGSSIFHNAGKICHKYGPSFPLFPIHSLTHSTGLRLWSLMSPWHHRAEEDVFDISFEHHEFDAWFLYSGRGIKPLCPQSSEKGRVWLQSRTEQGRYTPGWQGPVPCHQRGCLCLLILCTYQIPS